MKIIIKKIAGLTLAVIGMLTLSQVAFASEGETTTADVSSMQTTQVVSYFAILLLFILAPLFKTPVRNQK